MTSVEDEIPTRRGRRMSETSRNVVATAHEAIVCAARRGGSELSAIVMRSLGEVHDVGAAGSATVIRELRAELGKVSARVSSLEYDLEASKRELARLRNLMRTT